MVTIKEIWKSIQGYENYYEVSNLGRVKSLKRNVYKKDGSILYRKKEKIKTSKTTTDGYKAVTLSVDGIDKTFSVHSLVANAFIKRPITDSILEINHKDTNRANNSYNNLEWVTHKNNISYSANLGHYKGRNGANNPNFGNHVLHDRYKSNPELAKEKLARPGLQNGRCRKISVYDGNVQICSFGYIGDCACWLKDMKNLKANPNSIRQSICTAIKNNRPYHNFSFKYDN